MAQKSLKSTIVEGADAEVGQTPAKGSLAATFTESTGPMASEARVSPSRAWTNALGNVLPVLIDILLLIGAVLLSRSVSAFWSGFQGLEGQLSLGVSTAFVLLSVGILALTRAYDFSINRSLAPEWFLVVGVVSFVSMLVGLFILPLSTSQSHPPGVALLWGNAVIFMLVGRGVSYHFLGVLRRRGIGCRRVVIVGSPDSTSYAIQRLDQKGSMYRVVGLVNVEGGRATRSGSNGRHPLDGVDSLYRIIQASSPCEVLIAMPSHRYARIRERLHRQIPARTTVRLALYPLLDGVGIKELGTMEGIPAIQVETQQFSWLYERVKRAFDLLVATLALGAFAPVMLLIAIAIKLDSPGAIFFRQPRIGRGGRLFHMYKFRSMREDAEAQLNDLLKYNEASGPMFKLREDPRVTRVGRIIRRYSLDELPQLFNVFEGTMSLVGPRPPLPGEVKQYQDWHFRRLEVAPGITGLWQVKRGPENDFDQMVNLDLKYIDSWSLGLDIVILLKTLPAILAARAAY